jgi:hypothetical protein
MAPFSVKVKNYVPAEGRRKCHGTDILQPDLATVNDSCSRCIVDELSTETDIHLVEQIAIFAVKIVEPGVEPFAVVQVLVESAVAKKGKLPFFIDIGKRETKVLANFNLSLVVEIIIEPFQLG